MPNSPRQRWEPERKTLQTKCLERSGSRSRQRTCIQGRDFSFRVNTVIIETKAQRPCGKLEFEFAFRRRQSTFSSSRAYYAPPARSPGKRDDPKKSHAATADALILSVTGRKQGVEGHMLVFFVVFFISPVKAFVKHCNWFISLFSPLHTNN